MEEEYSNSSNGSTLYPILLLPKKCTTLNTNTDITENVFLDMKITSLDTRNNEVCIYSGLCNIKLVDDYKINVESRDHHEKDLTKTNLYNETQIYQADNQSQVWIDPIRSPYVYNQHDIGNSQDLYSLSHDKSEKHINFEQHNTYITQNVYNFNEPNDILSEYEHRRLKKNDISQSFSDTSYYLDELECGEACATTLVSDDFITEKNIKAREERRYVGVQNENSALKQLMSTNKESASKQRKTILFLGQDSRTGETVQKIAINDPSLLCIGNGEFDHEVIIDDTSSTNSNKMRKKYQCDKCNQIFDQISTFRQHVVSTHKYDGLSKSNEEFGYVCSECGKCLKTQTKFEQHCQGHGDPELECNKCHKVFASKFTLRAHKKIHDRKYPCKLCVRSYTTMDELRLHLMKIHYIYACDVCPYTTHSHRELVDHQTVCKSLIFMEQDEIDSIEFVCSESDTISPPPDDTPLILEKAAVARMEQVREADIVLAKVMANKLFLSKTNKSKDNRKCKKICDACHKIFDRTGDLKRHLIEHIIKSTFAKTPVSSDGTLSILCGICESETFNRVDTYKVHLREHAKLTLYKCTFCNKCFSDSSNFSKHKKIHGNTFFQCDLCQRKFNSKKMIKQHLDFHNVNSPVSCSYCRKIFHFKSMLNKHIKCTHAKNVYNKYRCRFCNDFFKTLKEKWDHEWTVHNVRKVIVDCHICGAKFRKYSELKRHCHDIHGMATMPNRKDFMKNAIKF